MLKIAAALIVASVATANAADVSPPTDQSLFMQKAIVALQAQRNGALDNQASSEARAAVLAEEIAKLKAEIEELKKKATSSEPEKINP